MHVRRSAVAAAIALPLALAGLLPAVSSAASAAAPAAAAAAPAPSRLILSDKPGIVLVDSTGRRSRVLVDLPRSAKADLVDLNVATGAFLYSTGAKKKTWHAANLYGAQLNDFTLPRNASAPAIDSGGYEYWWVRGGANAAVMAYEPNNPLATERVVRDLPTGTAQGLWMSPDDQWVATLLDSPTGRSLHVVSTDGKVDRVVPVPAGTALTGGRVVWSPDSGRVAFLAGALGAPTGDVYVAPVAGDYPPTRLAARTAALLDWSPDGTTLLTGTPGTRDLVALDAETGATLATYNLRHSPAGSAVLWTGLRAGSFPRDRIRPTLRITQPACGKRAAAACASYRSTPAAWRTIRGTVKDRGQSQLRYVAVAVFQKRGGQWWSLVGNGRHPIWKKFPNFVEARYTARERTAQIVDGRYRIKIPDLKAGRLYVVAKAQDGAGNNTAQKLQVELR
jgi:hypothetical protein